MNGFPIIPFKSLALSFHFIVVSCYLEDKISWWIFYTCFLITSIFVFTPILKVKFGQNVTTLILYANITCWIPPFPPILCCIWAILFQKQNEINVLLACIQWASIAFGCPLQQSNHLCHFIVSCSFFHRAAHLFIFSYQVWPYWVPNWKVICMDFLHWFKNWWVWLIVLHMQTGNVFKNQLCLI